MVQVPTEFSVAESLRPHPFFHYLGDEDLHQLAHLATQRSFAPGETIFLEGEACAGWWVVEKGRVKVYKVSPEGREHVMHLLGPHDSFNDIATLDGGPNPATAAALSDVLAWVIAPSHLRDSLRENGDLALGVIDGLTVRVRGLVQQLEDLALYSAPARLARFLLAQSEDPALDGPGITRAAIAAHIATTPETVSRALRALEESGAIRFDRHRIVIVDTDLLQDLANR